MIKVNALENYNVLDKYYVTTCGKVLSTGKGKIYGEHGYIVMKPNINKKGYHQYRLFDADGGSIRPYVHKLVAIAYIPNHKDTEQVDHIDMDKGNNYVGNLDWVTNLENMRRRINKIGFRNGASMEFTKEQIWYIRRTQKRWRKGKIWCSNTKDLAIEFGVNEKTITNIANRLSYKHVPEEV